MESNTDFSPVLQEDKDENIEVKEIKQISYKHYIQPAIFLIFLGWNLTTAVFTNEIVYQTCAVTLGFNVSDCKQLGTPNAPQNIQDLETIVQPYAATLKMVKSIVESLFPAIVNLFFGNWSDKYGRKPIIINSFIGYFLIYLLLSIISYIATIIPVNPWYYMIAFIPMIVTGGNCALTTMAFAYVTDVTNESDRPFKMGLLEACIFSGLLLASLSSSFIYNLTNTTTMFILSGTCVLFGLFYVIFLLDESLITTKTKTNNEEIKGISKLKEIFKFSLITDMITASLRKRPNYDRAIIWLTILMLGINTSAMVGGIGVFYLYVRERFQWTLRDYTFYEATAISTQIGGNLFAMFILMKIWKLPAIILVIIALLSNFVDTTITAIAFNSWHLYLALGLSLLKSLADPMARAVLAKVLTGNDIGKVYSLATSIESFLPIFSAFLYTYVYNKTLTFYPGAYNIISITLYGCCVGIMSFVFVLFRRRIVDVVPE